MMRKVDGWIRAVKSEKYRQKKIRVENHKDYILKLVEVKLRKKLRQMSYKRSKKKQTNNILLELSVKAISEICNISIRIAHEAKKALITSGILIRESRGWQKPYKRKCDLINFKKIPPSKKQMGIGLLNNSWYFH